MASLGFARITYVSVSSLGFELPFGVCCLRITYVLLSMLGFLLLCSLSVASLVALYFLLIMSYVCLPTSYFFLHLVFLGAATWRAFRCVVSMKTLLHTACPFSHFTDLRWMLVQWSCLESIAQRYLRPHAVSA